MIFFTPKKSNENLLEIIANVQQTDNFFAEK